MGVLTGAAAPGAAAIPGEGLHAQTLMLPMSTPVPTLKQLSDPATRTQLGEQSRRLAAGQTALETVGPAAKFGTRMSVPASVPKPLPPRRVKATGPAAVSYPTPAHTMSLADCEKHMRGDAAIYIKSRFAVCTGIHVITIWMRTHDKPIGTSSFDLYVRGTVKENDRTIHFDYDAVNFKKQNTTATSGLKIKLEGTIPKDWPSRANPKIAGDLPVTRTFDQLQRMPAAHFTHTVRYKPGQGTGSGKADVVFAVYQPLVTLTLPPGWVGDSPAVGKPAMFAPRWDAGKYLSNPTGGANPDNRGAASFSYLATLVYSTNASAPERGVAAHIKKAYTNPGATKPTNHNKKIAGQTPADPLFRLFLDDRRRKANHSTAVSNCRRYFGAGYADHGTKDCDEFPFQSTYQGCAQPRFDPHAEKNNFSVLPVKARQNQDAGILLGQFYKKNRIIDGMDDGFLIKITS
ncbi:hypothetical protein ACIF83_36000 [Streptomyces sp. NPDC085866]|uniref:NucA/NucB deoxyribonuclease domain-containing protein n=1 Tax=Streptomyces sp. NPDC085866 TaxID=3365736 RepID=UPI0037D833ED